MRRSVPGIGGSGIVRDIPAKDLPPNVWSDGRNVRFQDGKAVAMRGVQAVALVDAPIDGLSWVEFANGNSVKYYMYSTLEKMYSYDGMNSSDITRAAGGDYTGTLDSLWDLENYNGLAILNNGVDNIQLWTMV